MTDSTVEVAIKPNDSPHSYRGVLQLKDTKVMAFDPTADSGTPVAEQFPLHDASSSKQVGMVSMVLQVVRSVAPVDPLASFDVLYRINDSKLKSADRQEAEVRQLLACPKCSLPRANGDSCCGYEIVDGILSKKMVSSTEQMIERIKEKINQVKLDDAIGQRDSVSDTDGCGKFCAQCGGLTITGATCASSVANVRPGRARSSHTVAENRADEGLACGKDLSGRKSIKKTTKSSIRYGLQDCSKVYIILIVFSLLLVAASVARLAWIGCRRRAAARSVATSRKNKHPALASRCRRTSTLPRSLSISTGPMSRTRRCVVPTRW